MTSSSLQRLAHRSLAVAILAGAAVCGPSDAAAQSGEWASRVDDVRRDVRLHAGPLYVKPTLTLKQLGTDSNVFNASGEQQSDFTFTLTPQSDIWVPFSRRALFKTTMASDLVWYSEFENERSVDPQLTVRGEVYLNRVMFFGERAYLNSRQRPNYEIDVRSRHVEDRLAAGADVAFGPRLTLEIAARRADVQFDADAQFDGTSLQRTLNRRTDAAQLTLRHRVTPLTTVAARYEISEDQFDYSPVRDSRSYRLMPGVEFKPQALLKGSAWVGYRRFEPAAPHVLPEFGGLVADLGLTYTLLGATSFSAVFRRDLTYSYEETQPFFIDQAFGASIRRALGRRFDVIVSADRHRFEYQDVLRTSAGTAAAPVAARVDTVWNYTASVGYRLGSEGRVGFGASYRERVSTTKSFRGYDNLHVGTTVSVGF